MRKGWGGLLSRGRYGDFRAAMLQLEYFIRGVSPFAFILLLDRRSTLSQKALCALTAFWPVIRAYGSGTRSALIVAVLPLLAVIYYRCTPHWQKLLIYLGIASTPFVYFLMAAIVASRNSGQLDLAKGSNVVYVGNEMLQELAYVIDNVPERCDYQLGYSYYVQIVNPIPRFLWPGKPAIDSGLLMAQLKGEVNQTGEAYLTNSPGLLGEMYLNFGGWGILVLSFFGGWLVRGWDHIPLRHGSSLPTMILYCCGLALLFVIGRSFNATAFYALLFLYVGLFIVTHFILHVPVHPTTMAHHHPMHPRIQR
jgi:oligosaccharide repeat unit polymerase